MAAPIPADIRDAAVRDYLAGQSSTEVAARHGASPSAVIDWVRKAGHAVRTKAGGRPSEDLAYTGGWVMRGGIQVPLIPRRTT